MGTKRTSIVGEDPLQNQRMQELSGDDRAVNRSMDSEPQKLFSYRLPVSLGTKFKLYCHARRKTAEETIQEMLTEFLKDKTIDPEQ